MLMFDNYTGTETDIAFIRESLDDEDLWSGSVKTAQAWLRRVMWDLNVDPEMVGPVPSWYVAAIAHADEVTDRREAAVAYLRSYTGSFGFLTDMQARERKGQALSEKMVDAILRCADRDNGRKAEAAANPRLQEAADYLRLLKAENRTNEFTQSLATQLASKGFLSDRQIDALLNGRDRDAKRAGVKAAAPTVTEGMYRKADGSIFKVQRAVHGSGNLYAKRLVPPSEFGGKAAFEYAPGALRTLTADERMTLAEAKAFGALYGTCCVCGRTLTDEGSIEAGIGPVCAGKGEWA